MGSADTVDSGRPDDGMLRLARRWVSAFGRAGRLRTPHQLSGWPIIGSLLAFKNHRLELCELAARKGAVVGLRLGAMPTVLVSSPDLAHELLSRHHDDTVQAPTLRIVGEPLIGRGVLTADGVAHTRQRKLLAPAFTSKRMTRYADAMTAGAQRVVESWGDDVQIDASSEMMQMTLEIAARVLFDTEISHEARAFGRALTVAMERVLDAGSALVPLPGSWPTPGNLQLRAAVRRLDRTVARIVEERRRDPRDSGDVLSMLLEARDDDGAAMTDRLLRDEVMTLLLAGHETTANALSWCLVRLADDPAIRERLEREVDDVLGARSPAIEDLPRLPFLEAVLKETMRLHPPAYLVGRYTIRDLELGEAFLPAGTLVLVNIYGIHRSSKFFEDPTRFKPERFLAPNEAAIPKRAYMPFGTGPRTCIGNHFALLEGRLALAVLTQRVRLVRTSTSPVLADALLTLRPRGGVAMRVTRRTRTS